MMTEVLFCAHHALVPDVHQAHHLHCDTMEVSVYLLQLRTHLGSQKTICTDAASIPGMGTSHSPGCTWEEGQIPLHSQTFPPNLPTTRSVYKALLSASCPNLDLPLPSRANFI